MTPIERAAERAMHRMNESINRSAGQHMRAIRKAHTPVIELFNTEQVQADEFVKSRMAEHHPQTQQEASEPESAMEMLAYLLIAVFVTAAAILLSLFITR